MEAQIELKSINTEETEAIKTMVIEKEHELDIEPKKIECPIKEVLRRKRKVKVNDKIKITLKKDSNFGGTLCFLTMSS